jgi:hypothetical protein
MMDKTASNNQGAPPSTKTDTYYAWREWDAEAKCWATPWSDPWEYESPFNFVFDTPEKARELKNDYSQESARANWALVRIIEQVDLVEAEGKNVTAGDEEED